METFFQFTLVLHGMLSEKNTLGILRSAWKLLRNPSNIAQPERKIGQLMQLDDAPTALTTVDGQPKARQ